MGRSIVSHINLIPKLVKETGTPFKRRNKNFWFCGLQLPQPSFFSHNITTSQFIPTSAWLRFAHRSTVGDWGNNWQTAFYLFRIMKKKKAMNLEFNLIWFNSEPLLLFFLLFVRILCSNNSSELSDPSQCRILLGSDFFRSCWQRPAPTAFARIGIDLLNVWLVSGAADGENEYLLLF